MESIGGGTGDANISNRDGGGGVNDALPFSLSYVENLLSQFRFGIQFILCLGSVPLPIVGFNHSSQMVFVSTVGLMVPPILGEL